MYLYVRESTIGDVEASLDERRAYARVEVPLATKLPNHAIG